MQTNFFTTLMSTGLKHVVIEVKESEDGKLTVFITPKTIAKDAGLKLMKPLFLTAEAAMIDEKFFETVLTPLASTQQTFSNVESFEAQQQEAAKNTAKNKQEQDAKKKELDEKKKAEDEKKGKIQKLVDSIKKIVDAEDHNPNKDKDKVFKIADELLELNPENTYAKKVKEDLIKKTESIGLFNTED